MVMLIETDSRLEAWMMAAEFLMQDGPTLNLVLEIESPASNAEFQSADLRIDKFLIREDELPMHTVAETIFPGWQYRKRGLRGVFQEYPDKDYPSIKGHPSVSWGTYAYRLVRRHNANGKYINPLKQMIDKMQAELATKGTKKSCYEIGVAEGEYDLPLYNTVKDGTRHMGGPCLSHLSFKLFDGTIHLTAFYRSHDYRHKVPGNLLGLARLQACVARETCQRIGSLVVHSSYAYLNGSKTPLRTLFADIRAIRDH